jgi:hypothetical protein
MIIAKPVVPDQYWILQDQGHKVGNIEIDRGEYVISIGGACRRFSSLNSLTRTVRIDFEQQQPQAQDPDPFQVHGYPTTGVAHNPVFDVQHQLPLWTQAPRSRSWLAAGWYRVRQQRNWKIMQCPKLIILQRYQYQGPYRTAEEAQKS